MSVMANTIWWLFIIGLAVALDFLVLRIWRAYRQLLQNQPESDKQVKRSALLKEAIKTEFSNEFWRATLNNPRVRNGLGIMLELTLIAVWAIYVGRDYLDMDPRKVEIMHLAGYAHMLDRI